ncbi:hypothetical protein [Micromonospora haikouensis]|uniref:hypothetical protein n=1 Tax=Micromonospora haikouensis TaxID=686309 RepID=UPI003D714C63
MHKITTPGAALTGTCFYCPRDAHHLDTPDPRQQVRSPVCPEHATSKARPLTPATVDTELLHADVMAAGVAAALEDERLAERRPALTRELDHLVTRIAPLDAVHDLYRWRRWWAAPGGRVHASASCPTCQPITPLSWHVALSGADDATAAEEEGWKICTICVPAVARHPAFRTPGRRNSGHADARGNCLYQGPPTDARWTATPHGRCPQCTAVGIPVNRSSGLLRRHTHAEYAAERMRVARLTDPRLIGAPDGSALRVGQEEVHTVRAAERRYLDAVWWATWAGTSHSGDVDRHVRHALQLAEALAAKRGASVEEIIESMLPLVRGRITQ